MPVRLTLIAISVSMFAFSSVMSFQKRVAFQEHQENVADTTLEEITLDTISFVLRSNKKAQKIHRDTIRVEIDGREVLIPLKVQILATSAETLLRTTPKFRITGLSLREYGEFKNELKSLLSKPWDVLKDPIRSRNDSRYQRFFRPYVKGYENQNQTTVSEAYGSPESDEYSLNDEVENFPLPETIDFEVNLQNSPPILNTMGLEFNFNKLDPNFQKLLLEFRDKRGKSGNRSILK